MKQFLRKDSNGKGRVGDTRNKVAINAAIEAERIAGENDEFTSDQKSRLIDIFNNAVCKLSDVTRFASFYCHNHLNRSVDSRVDAGIRAEFPSEFEPSKYFYPQKHCKGITQERFELDEQFADELR